MPPAVARALLALLHAEGGERRDARADAADRQAVPEVPVLRRPSDGIHLRREGVWIGRRRAARLMSLMGLQAIYRAPRTSAPHPERRIYPYLLRGLAIERPNHVWCADITYIPVQRGFLYLVAIMDWASRYVLAWRLSNTLDASFCTDALDEALARHGKPEIVNTDQRQFTSFAFTGRLQAAGIRVSMDGRGRCMDNLHRASVALAQIRGDLSPRDRRRPHRPAPDRRLGPLLQSRGRTRRWTGGPRPRHIAATRLWI